MLVTSLDNYKRHLCNELIREYGFDFRGGCREGSKSQWPSGLRHRFTAARLLRFYVRISMGHRCLSVVSVTCFQEDVSASS